MRGRVARFTAAFQAMLLMATLVLPALAAATEITTDLWIYQQGDTVTVTGIDFGSEETVEVVTTDPYGVETDRGTAQTDNAGGFTYAFVLQSDVPGIYDVVATGLFTGLNAATQFDPLGGVTSTSTVEGSSGAANSHDVNVQVTATGSGTSTLYWRTANVGSTDGGAACGGTVDYVAVSQLTGIVTPNANFTIPVAICEDTTPELDEQFTLQVADNPDFQNGSGKRSFTGTITITNDDNSASIGDVAQNEGNSGTSPMTLTVTLNNPVPTGGTININYSTSPIGGTTDSSSNCNGGKDYLSTSGVLAFTAGQTTKTISVSICGDTTIEPDESFRVNLTAGAGNTGVTFGDSQAIGTIKDDDTPVTNTPPTVTVTGVGNGSSYPKGSVPAASCSVVDAEDGNTTFAAALSAISGPDAAYGIGSQTASCSYTDGGGLTDTDSVIYTITDGSAPTITYVVTPSAPDGTNAWYVSNVSLVWTVTEGDSPSTLVKTGCVDQSITTDQSATTYSCSATSAGGSAGPVSVTIKRDATAPTVTVTPARTADFAGWYNAPVVFDTAGSDATSGVSDANCTANNNYTGVDGTLLTVNGSCTDNAGNVGNGTSAAFNFDDTYPTVTVTPDRGPDSNGWYTSSVTFDTAGSDVTSGLSDTNCTIDQVYNGPDATGLTFNGSCTDNAGNTGDGTSVVFKFDGNGPTVSITTPFDAADGGTGWFNIASSGTDGVVVDVAASDGIGVTSLSCTDNSVDVGPLDPNGDSFVIHDGNHFIECTAADDAAHTGSDSDTFDVDQTAPVDVATALDRSADHNGWYNHAVGWTTTGTDATSGIDSCETGTYSGPDGTGLTVSGSCTDNAGNNSAPADSDAFKYDASKPTASVTIDDTPNGAGWFNSTVHFTTHGADNLSGIASCEDAADYSGPDADPATSVSVTCTDAAGNISDGATSANFKYDATAPVATVHIDDTPNGAGWFNSTVHFSTTGSDNLSGIFSCTDAADYSGPDSSSATSAPATCTDNAGNTSATDVSDAFMYDATAPIITYVGVSPASPNGANGWYISNVTTTFNATDATSGLSAACLVVFPDPSNNQTKVSSGEGTTVHTTSDACSDVAGNSVAAINSPDFNIDLNNPTVGFSSPASSYITVNPTVAVSGTAGDTAAGSQVSTVSVNGTAMVYGSGTWAGTVNLNCGANTFAALATEFSGRTGAATSAFTITRVCLGGLSYYQPIDQSTTSSPIINKGKYGRVIPVKVTATYNLGSGYVALTDSVMAANGLTMRIGVNTASCTNGAPSDTVEAYADAGSSNGGTNLFRWTSPQWIYNLDTGRPPAGVAMTIGSCYRLDVYVDDSYGGTFRISGTGGASGNYAIFQPTK